MRQDVAQTTPYATSSLSQETTIQKIATTTATSTPSSLKNVVNDYFSDIPELVDVARCESRFRQFDRDGRVLRGVINKGDVGVMQINEYYHGDRAQKLGYDLYSVEGNMAYARFLYEREGLTPWQSSSKCWHKEDLAIR